MNLFFLNLLTEKKVSIKIRTVFFEVNKKFFQVLELLCVLVRGGINYSMLDPETRLLNFVIEQVNEICTRNWYHFKCIVSAIN